MALRLLVPLDRLPADERGEAASALGEALTRRLAAMFPADEGHEHVAIPDPPAGRDDPPALLEVRVRRGARQGLRVRLEVLDGEGTLRVLVAARPPWTVRAGQGGLMLATVVALPFAAWAFVRGGGQAAAVMIGLPVFLAVAGLGLALLSPLRWAAEAALAPDLARAADAVTAALDDLRATWPDVGAARRGWSPLAVDAGVVAGAALTAGALTGVALSPDLDEGWVCLLAPAIAFAGCVGLAYLVGVASAALGFAEGERFDDA
ncbi:MAG: hypothetical protein M9894_09315 [Planctomycetes bacterium]|nr:hypothetical protein [Planctomycetota bacterium]